MIEAGQKTCPASFAFLWFQLLPRWKGVWAGTIIRIAVPGRPHAGKEPDAGKVKG
jgi:hypothetical protein